MGGGGMSAGGPAPKSGIVTAIGVVNFVFAGLNLLCGLLALVGGAIAGAVVSKAASESASTEANQATVAVSGAIGLIIIVMAVLGLIMGALMLAAGLGIVKRRKWGRMLTLILGGLSALMAVLSLVQFNIVGVLLQGGYAGLVLAVLLQKKHADEFS
jgi:hypothetical protein